MVTQHCKWIHRFDFLSPTPCDEWIGYEVKHGGDFKFVQYSVPRRVSPTWNFSSMRHTLLFLSSVAAVVDYSAHAKEISLRASPQESRLLGRVASGTDVAAPSDEFRKSKMSLCAPVIRSDQAVKGIGSEDLSVPETRRR